MLKIVQRTEHLQKILSVNPFMLAPLPRTRVRKYIFGKEYLDSFLTYFFLLQILEKYLMNLIVKSKTLLEENENNLIAYRNLLEAVFCTVMIFNKRRVGELQRMTLSSFLENIDNSPSSEFEKVLSSSEKILFHSLKRIVIRGKRGRGVPVLFDKKTADVTMFLINIRKNFCLDGNDYLFGIPERKTPIAGYAVMRKHALAALKGDKSKASLLTSTRLRKQLATITQIFKMNKDELEQLATFMGHTDKTHSQFYRLPDDVYQTAKVSKLLMLSKNAALFQQYKGKPLSEIELGDDVIEESDTENEEDVIRLPETGEHSGKNNTSQVVETEASVTVSNKNVRKKRKLVPWTSLQKKITEQFFENNIKKKVPPKKREVITLIDRNPGVFKNKTWPVIKVYVCNKFKNI